MSTVRVIGTVAFVRYWRLALWGWRYGKLHHSDKRGLEPGGSADYWLWMVRHHPKGDGAPISWKTRKWRWRLKLRRRWGIGQEGER